MGKASRRKQERRATTAAFMEAPHAQFSPPQLIIIGAVKKERLRRFKEWTRTLDVPPGDSVTFAPFPTRREVLREIDKELAR